MRPIHTLFLILSFSLLACGDTPPPASTPEPPSEAGRIDSFMLRAVEAGFSGSLLVLRDGKVVGLRPRGVEIEDFNQPRLMTAGEHASQMDRVWQNTDRISAADAG